MSNIKTIFALIILLSSLAFSQTTYDINVQNNGTMTGQVTGTNPMKGNANLSNVFINGVYQSGLTGTMSYITGRCGECWLQIGTGFNAGGSFIVTLSNGQTIFSGQWDSNAEWFVSRLGTGHFYGMTGTLNDANHGLSDIGAITINGQTDLSPVCFFSGTEQIKFATMHLVVN